MPYIPQLAGTFCTKLPGVLECLGSECSSRVPCSGKSPAAGAGLLLRRSQPLTQPLAADPVIWGVMTPKAPAREIAPGLCDSGPRSHLALRLAQGDRKLPGQFLQTRRQDGRGLRTFRTARRCLCHGATNQARGQRFQDAKGPHNQAGCKGLP